MLNVAGKYIRRASIHEIARESNSGDNDVSQSIASDEICPLQFRRFPRWKRRLVSHYFPEYPEFYHLERARAQHAISIHARYRVNSIFHSLYRRTEARSSHERFLSFSLFLSISASDLYPKSELKKAIVSSVREGITLPIPSHLRHSYFDLDDAGLESGTRRYFRCKTRSTEYPPEDPRISTLGSWR